MRVGVDLATEHLLGAGDGDLRDLAAQLFASAIDLDVDLGAPASTGACERLAVGLALLDDAVGARVRLIDDAARLVAGGREDLVALSDFAVVSELWPFSAAAQPFAISVCRVARWRP